MTDANDQQTPVNEAPQGSDDGTSNVAVPTSSPQGNIEHDDGSENVTVPSSTSPQQDSPAEHEKEQPKAQLTDREINKMSALEKERNQAAVRAKDAEYQRRFTLLQYNPQALDNEFVNDEKSFNEFRKQYQEKTGNVLPSHAELYTQPNNAVGGNSGSPSMTQSQINELVDKQVDMKLQNKEAINRLIQEVPEANPANMQSVEEVEVAKQRLEEAMAIAQVTISYRGNMSFADALVSAYKSLPEYQEDSIKKARLQGEIIGKNKAYGNQVGVSGTPTTGQTNEQPTMNVRMTSKQKAKYEELRAKNPKQAEYFAKSIASRQ
jgi:hypothetical protein